MYQTLRLRDLGLTLYAGFEHLWERTRGRDYDQNAPKLVVGATCWLPFNFYGTFEYAHLHEDYMEFNSAAYPTKERDDRRNSYMVRLARQIYKNIDGYIEYRHMRNVSNIGSFTFKSNVLAVGLTISF